MRISPAIGVRRTYRGIDVVETLERICAVCGRPRRVRVDQGREFTSKDVNFWARKNGVVMGFSRPGKLTDDAFAAAFNSRVRAELLSANWFLSPADARTECEAWRIGCNELRPHGSLGQKALVRSRRRSSVRWDRQSARAG